MFPKSKEAISYGEKLVEAEKHAIDDVDELDVPREIGIYLWRSKNDDDHIVYIGQALGRRGLYQRIIQQHLNVRYRKKGVEKSAFRREVAKDHNLEWEAVVPFIKENYTLSFITFPKEDKRLANFVEKLLQFELEPKYSLYKMTR